MGERMTPARVLAAAGLALVFLMSASVALAAGRVALVVGNSSYSHIARLPNPENDAADMAAALQRLGFEVTTAQDADRAALNEALRVFTRESVGADMALVFYAGHGLEMDGVNYLVPVDARLERDTDVRFETVALDDVLAATAGASLRMVILDACRNNPLARSMQRTVTRRSVSGGSFGDLNEDLLGDETLVAYAAAAGTTAADGRGRNSPYTSALLAYLEEPLELSSLFRRVRARVLESTDGQQRPHEYGSLLREHYLSGVAGPGPVAVAAADGAAARLQQETVFWQSIMNSRTAADFEAYLSQFPAGAYRALATNRLAALRASPTDPPARERPGAAEPGTVFRDCPTCPELVVIPAGRFPMGCVSGRDCDGDEQPVHEVEVASFALGDHSGPSDERGTSLFRTAEPGSGGGRIRCLCGGVVRGVLRVAAGPPESASWAVFPAAVHRLLRGSVVGAGDCVAGRGFSEPAGFPGPGRDRGAAEPLDAVAHAASDRRGNARGGFHVGAGTVGGSGSGAGEDGRRRCDDAGSERGDAEHRAAGYRGIVRGVRASAGEGIGD